MIKPVTVDATEFALRVRAFAEARGCTDHPVLRSGFRRRVVELARDGALPCERRNTRLYFDPALTAAAAEMLGLVASGPTGA